MTEDVKREDVGDEELAEMSALEVELQQKKQQLMQLDKEQLVDILAAYEVIIPKLGFHVKWCIDNFYKPVVCQWRMGRMVTGLLVGAVLVPESFIILAAEETKKYGQNKTYVKSDIRLVHAPIKELTYYDVILEEGEWEEQEGLMY